MMRKPSMKPTITCEPASRVPPRPSRNHFQGCSPLRTKYWATTSSLPGGRISFRRSGTSRRAPWKEAVLLMMPRARSSIGKNAKNMLKATAWLRVMQSGKMRPRLRKRVLSIRSIEVVGGIIRLVTANRAKYLKCVMQTKVRRKLRGAGDGAEFVVACRF